MCRRVGNTFLVGRQNKHLLLDKQDADRLETLAQKTGGIHNHNMGYAEYTYQENGKRYRILVHRLVAQWAGLDISKTIDHINGNRLDCRRNNLRAATQRQQLYNRGLETTNKTGFRGVHLTNGKYLVTISNKGKTEHVGVYTNIIKAAKAYDKRAKELRGPFAKLNFQER